MFFVSALAEAVRNLRMRLAILRNGRIAEIDQLKLKLPRGVISDFMAYTLLQGKYDQVDRMIIRKYVRAGDFVLELGTGCGNTAMVARQMAGNDGHVVTVEPDPQMHALARDNFALNGLDIDSIQGAAVANPATSTVRFYRSEHFWGSNINTDGPGIVSQMTVKGIYPPDLVANRDAQRKVLFCDVEGYEAELLAEPEILVPFGLIIVEVHNFSWPPKADGEALGRMFHAILEAGFRIQETTGRLFIFDRESAPPYVAGTCQSH